MYFDPVRPKRSERLSFYILTNELLLLALLVANYKHIVHCVTRITMSFVHKNEKSDFFPSHINASHILNKTNTWSNPETT